MLICIRVGQLCQYKVSIQQIEPSTYCRIAHGCAPTILYNIKFILISDKRWTKICEDIVRKTRRMTPQGCRLARTTTKYCGK